MSPKIKHRFTELKGDSHNKMIRMPSDLYEEVRYRAYVQHMTENALIMEALSKAFMTKPMKPARGGP